MQMQTWESFHDPSSPLWMWHSQRIGVWAMISWSLNEASLSIRLLLLLFRETRKNALQIADRSITKITANRIPYIVEGLGLLESDRVIKSCFCLLKAGQTMWHDPESKVLWASEIVTKGKKVQYAQRNEKNTVCGIGQGGNRRVTTLLGYPVPPHNLAEWGSLFNSVYTVVRIQLYYKQQTFLILVSTCRIQLNWSSRCVHIEVWAKLKDHNVNPFYKAYSLLAIIWNYIDWNKKAVSDLMNKDRVFVGWGMLILELNISEEYYQKGWLWCEFFTQWCTNSTSLLVRILLYNSRL